MQPAAKGGTSMKLQFVRKFNLAIYTLLGLGVLGTIGTVTARADQWDKKTILTVDQPIQVTDQVLAPGKYVLKLADSQADRHIVQIFNGDQSHIVSTVLAIPNYR